MAVGEVELDVGRRVVDDDGGVEAEVGVLDGGCVSGSLALTEDAFDRRFRTGREDDAQVVLDEGPFLGPKFDGARPWRLEPIRIRLGEDSQIGATLFRFVDEWQIRVEDHNRSFVDPAEVSQAV